MTTMISIDIFCFFMSFDHCILYLISGGHKEKAMIDFRRVFPWHRKFFFFKKNGLLDCLSHFSFIDLPLVGYVLGPVEVG
jgi:hypothetical protein